jgi:hypothetical protein
MSLIFPNAAAEFAVQPPNSPKPTSSTGEPFRRRIGPNTPIPLPSPNVGRQFVNVMSPPGPSLGTPFVPSNSRSLATTQSNAKDNHSLEDLSQRPQAVSRPRLTPSQHTGSTPVRDQSFHPGSVRRALAKTAHIHEVGRHRRVNSSHGRQSSASLETSPRTMHLIDSNEENEPRRRGALNASKTPTGTPRRSGSQARSRGSAGLRGTHSPSASASSFAHLSWSPPRCAKPIGRRKDAEELPESASGSDLWEDTSDAADGDGQEALAEAFFNPKSPSLSEALRSAENLPMSSPGHCRRHLKIDTEQPSRSPTCSPGTATRTLYVSEPRGAHLPPVALQS